MKKSFAIFLFIFPLLLFAQNPKNKQALDEFYIIKNDSLTIPLEEVVVFDKRNFKSKRKRKKKIKSIQEYMEGEFSDQLKKLTRTEGRILIKLIHRQTGETMYELIKEYRSGWKAFWYNSTANMFRLSLKKEYKPREEGLDFIVEDILQRSFINGTLEEQEPKLEIDYFALLTQYHDINVEKEITDYIDKYMK